MAKTKKPILLISIMTIILSLFAFQTIAYFTAEKVIHNVITTGSINIQLIEWSDKEKGIPFPKDGVSSVMPGATVNKVVEVKNVGISDAYIRVKVDKEIILANSNNANPDLGLMKINFDDEYWLLGDDGYYYYNKALKPDETTVALLSSVYFDVKMDNKYQNSVAKVNVTAYATQVANNGDSVLEAKGWPQ